MRMPGRAPQAEPEYEAMAETLNPRGDAYRMNELVFAPGEWVAVPGGLIERLTLLSWAQVRVKEN